MISKASIISQLKRIADNKNGKYLDHHQVLVIAYGIINVLDDVADIDTFYLGEIELYLRMLTKRSPHHARCIQAQECINYLRKGCEPKKSEESNQQMTPETF
jgi:hypothetical protein